MKQILTFVFGQRAEGQAVPEPSFKTTYPNHRPDVKQWAKDYNFGSKYGYRGSFYHKPEHVRTLVVTLDTPLLAQ